MRNGHLPGGARYKADFVCQRKDRPPIFAEIKGGFIREKDLIRFKVAAGAWSWLGEFQLWQFESRKWERIR